MKKIVSVLVVCALSAGFMSCNKGSSGQSSSAAEKAAVENEKCDEKLSAYYVNAEKLLFDIDTLSKLKTEIEALASMKERLNKRKELVKILEGISAEYSKEVCEVSGKLVSFEKFIKDNDMSEIIDEEKISYKIRKSSEPERGEADEVGNLIMVLDQKIASWEELVNSVKRIDFPSLDETKKSDEAKDLIKEAKNLKGQLGKFSNGEGKPKVFKKLRARVNTFLQNHK